MQQPHLYLRVNEHTPECLWCGLPEINHRHNTRPVARNPRTKRLEYTDKEQLQW